MKKIYSFTLFLLKAIDLYGLAQVGFNKVGYINQAGPTQAVRYNSVIIDSNNKIVVAGQKINTGSGFIARYNQDGSFDTTFNPGSVNGAPGYTNQPDAVGASTYRSVVIDSNKKIVVVGQINTGNGLIVRYNENGTLDTTFNQNSVNGGPGYINEVNVGLDAYSYNSVAVNSNNKIVVVGRTYANNGLIARYNQDGTLDQTFNEDSIDGGPGYINANLTTNSLIYRSVVIDSNHKILVIGQTDAITGLIARYHEHGVLDETFNQDSINGAPGYIDQTDLLRTSLYNSIIIDNKNRIVVGSNQTIERYTQDGILDTTFNKDSVNGGPGYINQAGQTGLFISTLVDIDTNNNIIVVARTNVGNLLIARYTQDGILDTTFNASSIDGAPGYINQPGAIDAVTVSYNAIIHNNHKIIVIGQTNANHGLIARYLTNGKIDSEANWNSKNYREISKINQTLLGMLSASS